MGKLPLRQQWMIDKIESHYKHKFSKFFRTLWNEGMMDWMNGRTIASGESWSDTVYPEIRNNPPVLLHTGGLDFEMLSADEILNFKFDEFWDTERHHFIPFAKTKEGDIFALYKNLKTNTESAVVCIWNDMNETEILAKNFEDFIFRKMLEAVYDIDKEELEREYEDGFEGYRNDILCDLKSIRPHLNEEYVDKLEEIYHRDIVVVENVISYSLLTHDELCTLIKKHLDFKELDSVFEHEVN